jgi:hypothetical protein
VNERRAVLSTERKKKRRKEKKMKQKFWKKTPH